MADIELSVCIANWNCRDLLRRCLESLRAAATGMATEVIVVDNDSRDGAPAMVARDFPDVILLCNELNEGFSRANNRAARASRGQYLLFLNNDTVVAPDCLRKLVEFLKEHPGVGMAGPKVIGGDGRPQKSYRRRPTLGAVLHRLPLMKFTGLFRRAYRDYRRNDYVPDATRAVEVLFGAAVCLPREVFWQSGGWDEAFPFGVEDVDLSTRVGKTHTLMYFPEAQITHLGRSSSRLNNGYAFTGLECGHARYLRKHVLGPTGMVLYKLLVLANLPAGLGLQLARQLWRKVRHGSNTSNRTWLELTALWQFCRFGLGSFLRT
jgi:GT2 family glycosyltransferase